MIVYITVTNFQTPWQACLLRGAGPNRSRAQGRVGNYENIFDWNDHENEDDSIGTQRKMVAWLTFLALAISAHGVRPRR